jgi:aspartate-semialdehyde dehydrogenase
MNKPLGAAVLAATGSVGQRFVSLLDGHPWFKVVALTGSSRKEGMPYHEACDWLLPDPMPDWARDLQVMPSDPGALDVSLVFSALPSAAAKEIEPRFALAGRFVCSNASAYRSEPDVPILMPEVNPGHLDVIPAQQAARSWPGAILTNSNCTSAGLTVTLSALEKRFGIQQGVVVTMQALSGAGYPGVPSLAILDNVIPYIPGEEEKVEWEPRKMLGSLQGGAIHPAGFKLSAHANRVAVRDGHMVCLSIKLVQEASLEDVAQALVDYTPPELGRGLPSTPTPVIRLFTQRDRPQPLLDRLNGRGMTTTIGRLRPDPVMDYRMVILSHNTIRGAAGGSIYNAELLVRQGYLD